MFFNKKNENTHICGGCTNKYLFQICLKFHKVAHKTKMNNSNTPEAINDQIISGIESIVYLQGDINYTNLIYLNGKKKTMSRTLKRFEELSPFKSWFRIHRAYLVNPKFVTTVCVLDSTVVLDGGLKLPISRRRLLGFKESGWG